MVVPDMILHKNEILRIFTDFARLFRILSFCLECAVDFLPLRHYNNAYRFIFIHPETSGAKA